MLSKDKIEPFRAALKKKLDAEDFNFTDVYFPEEADFSSFTFSNNTDFKGAIFTDFANFKSAEFKAQLSFLATQFSGSASFHSTTFSQYARFDIATFSLDVGFESAKFNSFASFERVTFNADASFDSATFNSDAIFFSTIFSAYADFNSATFNSDATFYRVTFRDFASFDSATFNDVAEFGRAAFIADTSFYNATFNADVRFNSTTFNATTSFVSVTFNNDANFHSATFNSYVYFFNNSYIYFSETGKNGHKRNRPRMSFQFARFEKPDRVSFHTFYLRPHWFLNVDPRKFEFIDVEFKYVLLEELKFLGGEDRRLPRSQSNSMSGSMFRIPKGAKPRHRMRAAESRSVSAPHRLLAVACRQLADNAEANHRYHEASRLRYSAFEARRIEKHRGFVPWRLDWWYWLASGYGERVGQAFLIFVLLIGMFAFGYKFAEFEPPSKPAVTSQPPDPVEPKPKTMGWREAALYSFKVAILQKPEPKPRGLWSDLLVSLETVLGPAQAALLALALRRRFMR